jgi:hypothetical protein
VNPAVCKRGTDGVCAWQGPTCVPCPVLVCPLIACPVTAAAAQPEATGCPTCTCTPVTTQ